MSEITSKEIIDTHSLETSRLPFVQHSTLTLHKNVDYYDKDEDTEIVRRWRKTQEMVLL
jgi:hypothetical protein